MKNRGFASLLLVALTVLLPSCHRTSREMWEDSKTAGRYMDKGLKSLFGRHDDRAAKMRAARLKVAADRDEEFIALSDDDRYHGASMQDYNAPLSKESPGDPGSPIPGIEGFKEPSGHLATLFNRIRFETDSYIVQGEDNIETLNAIANHLSSNPHTYVFVEGHADERGSASYNLSLGSKRANSVRNYLVEHGVNPDQLFSISFGKERPIVLEHSELAWNENRRAQFKLYEK